MLLAALVGSGAGSADGVVVAAAGGDAGVVVAVSFFRVSAAGAVTISDGLVFAASGTVAVVSSLKSLMVEAAGLQVRDADRGVDRKLRGTAAGSAWASAEVADTVRKVAATAISTRSNQHGSSNGHASSHPLAKPLRHGTALGIVRHSFRLHATIHAQTIHVALASNQRHPATHDKLTSSGPHFNALRALPRTLRLSVTAKQRFKCSGIADVLSLFVRTPQRHIRASVFSSHRLRRSRRIVAVASSSLR